MFIYLHKDDLYQPFKITSPIGYPRLNISIRNTHSKIPASTTDIPKKKTIDKKISEIKYSKTANKSVNTTTVVPASTNSIQRVLQDLSTGSLKPKSNWYKTSQLISRTSNCTTYFETFPVFALQSKFVKGEEKKILEQFPLAFSHMVHKDISIFEVFLSIYFRPDNFHCVHVDAKASQDIRNAVEQLIKCYSDKTRMGSIAIIPKDESISVEHSKNSLLIADMRCHHKLLEYKSASNKILWKYDLPIAGSELPITSYARFHNKLSRGLQNDESSVESFSVPPDNMKARFTKQQMSQARKIVSNNVETLQFELSYNQTFNLTFQVFKGSRYIVLSAKDTEFVVNHPVSKFFFKWLQQGTVTEEHFYSTLIRFHIYSDTKTISQNTNRKTVRTHPGGLTFTEGNTLHGMCPHYTHWGCNACHGKCINYICNFNQLDLHELDEDSNDCLIANKFNLDVDPAAVTTQLLKLLYKVCTDGDTCDSIIWNSYLKKTVALMLKKA